MLDYLEKGVFDALDKQYLQSFVFAIYLVSGFTANAPVWFNVVRPTFRTKQILQSMCIVFSFIFKLKLSSVLSRHGRLTFGIIRLRAQVLQYLFFH